MFERKIITYGLGKNNFLLFDKKLTDNKKTYTN